MVDDIWCSGFMCLFEVLRFVFNFQVVQVYNGGYVISVCGFNGNLVNKLLVFIDGCLVYMLLFVGVFWDVQDVVLEDVECIEVSSGLGSMLWGVNVVNGVINIIMCSVVDIQGILVLVVVGEYDCSVLLCYGLVLSGGVGGGNLCLYFKCSDNGYIEMIVGSCVDDVGYLLQGGFWVDWGCSGDGFMLQGNVYCGNYGQLLLGSIFFLGVYFVFDIICLLGVNLFVCWECWFGGGDLWLQGYFDCMVRVMLLIFDEGFMIGDLELQYMLCLMFVYNVVFGVNYCCLCDYVGYGVLEFVFLLVWFNQVWISLFVQDEIVLVEGLCLMLGICVECNDYMGSEVLFNVCFVWQFVLGQLWWVLVVCMVCVFLCLDCDVYVLVQLFFLLDGGLGFCVEMVDVLELGYCGQLLVVLMLLVIFFYGDYDYFCIQELVFSCILVYYGNGMQGWVSGLELWVVVQVVFWLCLYGGFMLLCFSLYLWLGSIDMVDLVFVIEGVMLCQVWQLCVVFNLLCEVEFDVMLCYVGVFVLFVVLVYMVVDLWLGGWFGFDIEVVLSGCNFLDCGYVEFIFVEMCSEIGCQLLL